MSHQGFDVEAARFTSTFEVRTVDTMIYLLPQWNEEKQLHIYSSVGKLFLQHAA